MAVDFKNSETKDNLMRAFAGESQARNRYTISASQAKKQNLYVVSAVFRFTADQEKEHASIFYNHLSSLSGVMPLICSSFSGSESSTSRAFFPNKS